MRKTVAVLTCLAFLAGSVPAVMAQPSTAAITGVILDPDGKPAVGFKVVLRDMASNQEFVSDPTDVLGHYVAKVPVGGRYKLAGVIANDGATRLAVQDVPPVNVLTAGTTSLNVRFSYGSAPGVATTDDDEKRRRRAVAPWYRRPGPIVGMVIGGVAIIAIAAAAGGGGSNNEASQFQPPDR